MLAGVLRGARRGRPGAGCHAADNCALHLEHSLVFQRNELREARSEQLVHGCLVVEDYEAEAAVVVHEVVLVAAASLKPRPLHDGELAENGVQVVLVHLLRDAAHEHLPALAQLGQVPPSRALGVRGPPGARGPMPRVAFGRGGAAGGVVKRPALAAGPVVGARGVDRGRARGTGRQVFVRLRIAQHKPGISDVRVVPPQLAQFAAGLVEVAGC
mmetsp:Transcript_72388/g.204597  ORF Transcript_72388/g.204597 Transcript_72388/m.204597 type:complete len:214 (+) Transcript_72388:770-1411(+)